MPVRMREIRRARVIRQRVVTSSVTLSMVAESLALFMRQSMLHIHHCVNNARADISNITLLTSRHIHRASIGADAAPPLLRQFEWFRRGRHPQQWLPLDD